MPIRVAYTQNHRREQLANLVTLLESTQSGLVGTVAQNQATLASLDQKDEKGNYRYLTPAQLNADSAQLFEQTLDKIFAAHSTIFRELVGYIRKTNDKPEDVSKADWKSITTEEAASIAANVLPQASLVPQRGELRRTLVATDKLQAIADELVPQTLSPGSETLDLIHYTPRNEMELVANILFELSALPEDAISEAVDELKYDDSIKLLRAYLESGKETALSSVSYTWEIIESSAVAREVKALLGTDVHYQEFSPRLGYDVPKIIEEAGLSDHYERCFDMSYSLYSKLQGANYEHEAELATLLGHRLRWRITFSPLDNRNVDLDNASDATYKLLMQMAEKLEEVHPTIAA